MASRMYSVNPCRRTSVGEGTLDLSERALQYVRHLLWRRGGDGRGLGCLVECGRDEPDFYIGLGQRSRDLSEMCPRAGIVFHLGEFEISIQRYVRVQHREVVPKAVGASPQLESVGMNKLSGALVASRAQEAGGRFPKPAPDLRMRPLLNKLDFTGATAALKQAYHVFTSPANVSSVGPTSASAAWPSVHTTTLPSEPASVIMPPLFRKGDGHVRLHAGVRLLCTRGRRDGVGGNVASSAHEVNRQI